MVQVDVLHELDWLARTTKKQCRDFRHLIYVSMTAASQSNRAIVRFTVPDGACWIVTATTLRCFPLFNAAFQTSDFSSDENFDPVQEMAGNTPYGRAWWAVNNAPSTPVSAIWLGVMTTPCLFVFRAGAFVELKFSRAAAAVSVTQLAARINSYIGPADAEQALSQMTTQIISHTDY